jgi:hypothetical protein
LAKAIMGASNIIFMKRMWYSNNIFDRIDHWYPFSFQVPQYFIVVCFHDFLPIWQIPNIYWGYGWNKHKYIAKNSQFKKPKVGLRRFILPSLSNESYNAH